MVIVGYYDWLDTVCCACVVLHSIDTSTMTELEQCDETYICSYCGLEFGD